MLFCLLTWQVDRLFDRFDLVEKHTSTLNKQHPRDVWCGQCGWTRAHIAQQWSLQFPRASHSEFSALRELCNPESQRANPSGNTLPVTTLWLCGSWTDGDCKMPQSSTTHTSPLKVWSSPRMGHWLHNHRWRFLSLCPRS